MKHIVLYSGGLDSFITAEYVRRVEMRKGDTIELVYMPLGHQSMGQELFATRFIPNVVYLSGLDVLGEVHEDFDAYIWARNAFLVLLAAKRIPDEMPGKIWLTVQKDELSIPDRTPQFFKAMTGLLVVLGKCARVDTPWWKYDKTDMVTWYLNQSGALPDTLKKTHSCYRPAVLPCGDCPACIRRFIAMELNDIHEEYEIDPRTSKTAQEYLQRARDGYYSEERNKKTLLALEEE
jgi:7-cyano-7-deazaguanine synthase in queuosine biosynthesis